MGERTVFPLNASITLSPASLDPNTISASMIGLVFTTRQTSISPPTGVITLSISAAVVPGAKFCIRTENGPARPLIEISGSGAFSTALLGFLCWFRCGFLGPVGTPARALGPVGGWGPSKRWRAPASLAARFAARGFAPGAEMREAREGAETVLWRSCVHSPLTLPAGLAVVEATLCRTCQSVSRVGMKRERQETIPSSRRLCLRGKVTPPPWAAH